MTVKLALIAALAAIITICSSRFSQKETPVAMLFHQQTESVIASLKTLEAAARAETSQTELEAKFNVARIAYKHASILVDYFFPIVRRTINGPDLKYADDDSPQMIHEPHGFQVIERIIFTNDKVDRKELAEETHLLLEIFQSIRIHPGMSYTLKNELVFDALRSATIRLIAMGITGFDSPMALQSIPESAAVLEGMNKILLLYPVRDITPLIEKARTYLMASKSFDKFDRLKFISIYADPIYGKLVANSKDLGYTLPVERRPINQAAVSIFASDFLDVDFFSPNKRYQPNEGRAALGKSLFSDPLLSLDQSRSCASCHQPERAFTDGLTKAAAFDGQKPLSRNTPTLLGAAYQTKFFYDSRASTLENQLSEVVHQPAEMRGSLKEAVNRIRKNEHYATAFSSLYPNEDDPVTEYSIANAISCYIRSLQSNTARFDEYMRGEEKLSGKEKRGFNLFAGKAKCATCHYIPLFNGLVPPQFSETESEVLGVPASATQNVLDEDQGKINFTKSEIHRYAFKTPTLRNIALTAPYMHNGAFNTLEQVMNFYNKGGGTGLHIAPSTQTLQPDSLRLSKKEISEVIAFLKTLNDTRH